MDIADLDGIRLHYRIDGDPGGAPVVFSNSLGTDLRLWDKVIARLPKTGLKYIRYDTRGHGLSDSSPAPYSMGTLVRDAERLMDHLGVTNAVFRSFHRRYDGTGTGRQAVEPCSRACPVEHRRTDRNTRDMGAADR